MGRRGREREREREGGGREGGRVEDPIALHAELSSNSKKKCIRVEQQFKPILK